jgi:hypothetical protein
MCCRFQVPFSWSICIDTYSVAAAATTTTTTIIIIIDTSSPTTLRRTHPSVCRVIGPRQPLRPHRNATGYQVTVLMIIIILHAITRIV